MGVAAMMEAIELVRLGNAPKMVQDPDAGSYEGWCRKADVQIDWSRPVAEVYNLIRGANPQPGAWSTRNGVELTVYDCTKTAGSGAPGEIIASGEDSFSVAAGDGAIAIQKVREQGGQKLSAGEYAAQSALKTGETLG